MKIELLTYYNDNKDKFKHRKYKKIEPCSLEEIELLESQINNGTPFPKAFREYLYIGGHKNGLPISYPYKAMYPSVSTLREKLAKRGVKFDRPFVIIDKHELSYSFIYLDDGDDPQPWNCSVDKAYDSDDGEIIWKAPFENFSKSIKVMTDLAIEGLGL